MLIICELHREDRLDFPVSHHAFPKGNIAHHFNGVSFVVILGSICVIWRFFYRHLFKIERKRLTFKVDVRDDDYHIHAGGNCIDTANGPIVTKKNKKIKKNKQNGNKN